MAVEMGVEVVTIRDWEHERRRPLPRFHRRMTEIARASGMQIGVSHE